MILRITSESSGFWEERVLLSVSAVLLWLGHWLRGGGAGGDPGWKKDEIFSMHIHTGA